MIQENSIFEKSKYKKCCVDLQQVTHNYACLWYDCELKSVNKLTRVHEVQLVNYLNAIEINDGLLINFGSERVEVKHKYGLYKKFQLK